jgi:hypothetical protein
MRKQLECGRGHPASRVQVVEHRRANRCPVTEGLDRGYKSRICGVHDKSSGQTLIALRDSISSTVGPLTARPPISGEMATVRPRRGSSKALIPGTRRMGPMLMIGLLGAIRISRAAAIASAMPGAGLAWSRPVQ